MTPQTRRNVFRYGIAVDLIILATGAGMFLPPSAAMLFPIFGVAVLLSVWKGRWQGGLCALLLSVVVLAAMFGVGAKALVLFALVTAAVGAALDAMWRSRALAAQPSTVPVAPQPVLNEKPEVVGVMGTGEALPLALTQPDTKGRVARERKEAEHERTRLEAESVVAERGRREAEEIARALEERLDQERAEAERLRKESEARLAQERKEGERERARLEAARLEADRIQKETEGRLSRERDEAARALAERLELEREESERARKGAEEARVLQERRDVERAEAERLRRESDERVAQEREEATRLLQERLEAERAEAQRVRRELEERAARELEEGERRRAQLEAARNDMENVAARDREAALAIQTRAAAERAAIEEKFRKELDQERESMRVQLENQLAAEREAFANANRVADARPPASTAPKPSIVDTVAGWFRRGPRPATSNLVEKRTGTKLEKSPQSAAGPGRRNEPQTKARKPRLVLLERRRGTAETIAPKLRQRGLEVYVVERWVDAADELLRVKPDLFFLDVEHPDFDVVHKTTVEKSSTLPIILTGRSSGGAPNVRYAAFVTRPYDVEEVTRFAQQAMTKPEELLAMQRVVRHKTVEAAGSPGPALAAAIRREPPASQMIVAQPAGMVSNDDYEVSCFTCRVQFNAVEADWCSCLAKERTLVCTNCLSCFCKAPPAFKEKFWVEAPSRLFERKTAEARKQQGALPMNAAAAQIARPLVLTVEDDEDIQAIVQRICTNLGYGFVFAMNGQEGLELAREYRPNLILSDAFMPKLDGREMCRQLKEDPAFADTHMVVMTGLYTDTKYRSEALKRFRVDDYISKPVSVTDLINLLQKHLEGVAGLPVQEDLHELHRKDLHPDENEEADISLAQMLASEAPDVPDAAEAVPVRSDGYDVCCFNCDQTFDATHAEWCRCVGRDHTLACMHCGGCFCRAPAAYKERFWIDAPPSLFERKMIGSKRSLGARVNPPLSEVKRPLILLVEDDENVQLIVRTVVTTLGFGFVVGADGQEGLSLAREYSPELILSDAFMPKLDGREMCRLLKEDPNTARSKAIIMTGLYTDRKYRNEALDYFKVDDYVAKPLAVDDLIKLFKKHLPQEVATAH